MTTGQDLWRSHIIVPSAIVPALLEALEDAALSVSAFEADGDGSREAAHWRIELVHRGRPDRDALVAHLAPHLDGEARGSSTLTIEPLPDTNWLAAVATRFAPMRIGQFFVHGSHIEDKPPQASVAICIDAGLAFGSGEHSSTRGCLLAIDAMAEKPVRRVLDMGCGSGLLAIAAAKTWPARIIAADNDATAVTVARGNAAINNVASSMLCLASDGYADPRIAAGGPYDVILANILAEPLSAMAADLAAHLAPGGTAVLAGLLRRQEDQVITAHTCAGLICSHRHHDGPWSTLTLTAA